MLETLSPQEAMTLFRNGGAFFVDVRTEKEFLKRAIPGCPLVPLDKLEREGGLDSRFSGKPVVFFCRSGSRTQNKAELLERSASGKSLMAVISMNVLFFLIFALPIAVYFKGLARLFMRSRKGLYNRETYFIEAVSQFINLISVVVIRNNRQCTCQDTECRIDQRLGNTL